MLYVIFSVKLTLSNRYVYTKALLIYQTAHVLSFINDPCWLYIWDDDNISQVEGAIPQWLGGGEEERCRVSSWFQQAAYVIMMFVSWCQRGAKILAAISKLVWNEHNHAIHITKHNHKINHALKQTGGFTKLQRYPSYIAMLYVFR